MMSLIPKYATSNLNEHEWMGLCIDSVQKLIKHGLENFQTSIHYERQYLKVVQTNNLYGMSYFPVEITMPGRYRKHKMILLGINWKHIVLQTLDYQILKLMSLKNLKSLKQDKNKPHSLVILKHRDKSDAKVKFLYILHLILVHHKILNTQNKQTNNK